MCSVLLRVWGSRRESPAFGWQTPEARLPCRIINISCVEIPTIRPVGASSGRKAGRSEAPFQDRHPCPRASRHHRRVRADDGGSGRAVRRRRPGDRGPCRVVAARTGAVRSGSRHAPVPRRLGARAIRTGGALTAAWNGCRFVMARPGGHSPASVSSTPPPAARAASLTPPHSRPKLRERPRRGWPLVTRTDPGLPSPP